VHDLGKSVDAGPHPVRPTGPAHPSGPKGPVQPSPKARLPANSIAGPAGGNESIDMQWVRRARCTDYCHREHAAAISRLAPRFARLGSGPDRPLLRLCNFSSGTLGAWDGQHEAHLARPRQGVPVFVAGHLTDSSTYGVKRICANTLAWICDLLTGPNILESRLLPRLSPATKYIPSGSTICLKPPQS
jgi:hypothetical protein